MTIDPRPDPARIIEEVKAHAEAGKKFSHVAVVHHETTAGVLNPVNAIGNALKVIVGSPACRVAAFLVVTCFLLFLDARMHARIHTFTHAFTHARTQASMHAFFHCFIRSFIYSIIHSFVYLFDNSFVRSTCADVMFVAPTSDTFLQSMQWLVD